MKIEITIPDEAIQRIADGLKRDIRMNSKNEVTFNKDGIELIQGLLQDKIDDLFMRTDPEFIEAHKAAKKLQEDGKKAAKEKLEAAKK